MNPQTACFRLLVGCACTVLSAVAGAADLVQTHEPLVLNVGLGGWGYDTGWMGVPMGFGGVYVDLAFNVGGTVLDVSMNGQGKLAYPTAVNQGDLSFLGAAEGGYASENLGIQVSGKFKINIAGADYTGDLPYMPNTDVRLADSKTFTPYQLGNSVTLSDSVSAVPVYIWNIGVPNLFSGDIGVSITGSDSIQVNFKSLHTDKAEFTADGQSNPVSVTDPTLVVGDIHENLGIAPSMVFTPNIVVGITVLYIPYHIVIPTFPITVPLSSLVQAEYPTTPPRSVTFQIPPSVVSLGINNGAPYTAAAMVTLNNICSNTPTDCMASENAGFSGADWQPYSSVPVFVLSAGDGLKQVFFKTRNGAGESPPVSGKIMLDPTPPTGTILINNNRPATKTPSVSLALTWDDGTGSGVSRMRFSNDGSTWTAWEAMAKTRAYTLPAGDGYKTVRGQYLDKAGNRSAVCNDFIRLDTVPPTGGIIINSGAATTTTQAVRLALTWADTGSGVTRMRFSDNGSTWTAWESQKATRAYTLPAALGYHTVRVQYSDAAENYSPVYNDYIKVVAP